MIKFIKIFLIICLICAFIFVFLLSYLYYTECKYEKWATKVTKEAHEFLNKTFLINKSKNELIKRYNLKYKNTKIVFIKEYTVNKQKIPIEIWATAANKCDKTKIVYEFNKARVWSIDFYFYGNPNLEKEQILQLINKNLFLFQACNDEKIKIWQIGSLSQGIGILFSPLNKFDNSQGYKLCIVIGDLF